MANNELERVDAESWRTVRRYFISRIASDGVTREYYGHDARWHDYKPSAVLLDSRWQALDIVKRIENGAELWECIAIETQISKPNGTAQFS